MGQTLTHLEYFDGTMYEMVAQTAAKYPDYVAYDFMGKATTYRVMLKSIAACARGLQALGIRAGSRITIALPNCPQAVCMFYAVNLIGCVANMIHPLSAEKEIEFYLNESESVAAVTLDQFYGKFAAVRKHTKLRHLIIASVQDALSPLLRLGYALTEGRKIPKIPAGAAVVYWKDFLRQGKECVGHLKEPKTGEDTAVILYSGGTTGIAKGVMLSNRNFNALSQQIRSVDPAGVEGDRMLAAMPMFHGFGLGICIHSMLSQGGRCILVPRFTPKSYARDMVKYRCNYIAGVPTLYEALLRLPGMEKADLSCLKGVFAGGDSLSPELKKRLDQFLKDHQATIQVREGYGTTETVTACCLTPADTFREGSVGLPFPDMRMKIVAPGTQKELPAGEEGEIVLTGPTVMKGYLNHPEETEKALQAHPDGLLWVHTGDLGIIDGEGYLFFRGRSKRMIVSSGYNIYPAQIENILDAHEKVQLSCVIGIPDGYKKQKVKAFVQLVPGIPETEQTKQELLEYCSKNIAKYAMPCDITFRKEFPKTLVGKVAYRVLEQEETGN